LAPPLVVATLLVVAALLVVSLSSLPQAAANSTNATPRAAALRTGIEPRFELALVHRNLFTDIPLYLFGVFAPTIDAKRAPP